MYLSYNGSWFMDFLMRKFCLTYSCDIHIGYVSSKMNHTLGMSPCNQEK